MERKGKYMKCRMTVPSYMEYFKCIAGECEETCCAGWYIAIDEPTYEKYRKVKSAVMKKRFEKEIVVKKSKDQGCVAKIKLKNSRCAFLNQENLCDIYKELGEAYLSETCKMYPRNTNAIGGKIELSLALSCPEAARQILLNPNPIYFSEQEAESLPIVGASIFHKQGDSSHFEDYILPMRQLLADTLQQPNISLRDKCLAFERHMKQFDRFKSKQEIKKLVSYLEDAKAKGNSKVQGSKVQSVLEAFTSENSGRVLLTCLVTLRTVKKWPSTRYEQCYSQMIEGLGTKLDHKQYERGKELFESLLMEQHPYVLEHYIVNYIYERLVPINQKSPLESLEELCLYLALIRLHLIGMGAYLGTLTLDDCITCIQSFTRVFDHNELYMHQIKKQMSVSKKVSSQIAYKRK